MCFIIYAYVCFGDYMKLKSKFALIVTLTVIEVCMLTAFALHGFQRIQSIKEYQRVQFKTQSDLSNMIVYLDEMDNWGFKTTTARRVWDEKRAELEDSIEAVFKSPVAEAFEGEFTQALNETKTIWDVVKIRFEVIEPILSEMEAIKLPISIYTATEGQGIRYAYERMPDDERVAKLMDLLNQSHEPIKGVRRACDTLTRVNSKSVFLMEGILEKQLRMFNITTVSFAAFSCIVLVLFIAILTTKITKRINSVQKITSTLAEKDFSENLAPNGSDEMKYLMIDMNEMIEQINSFFLVVKETAGKAIESGATINESTDNAAMASAYIDRNINSMSEKFDLIKISVEKAVSYIEEMDRQIKTLVENNSRQAAAIEDSNNSVNDVVDTLNHMNQMAEERSRSAQEMHNLVADGDDKVSMTSNLLDKVTKELDEIQEVVDIINNVAEQTNLLSMNAAIESAHAGEAGKGFAVVAEEIRALAENTTENASKIASVINSVVEAVENANHSSSEAAKAFAKVSNHADSVVESLKDISDGIGKIDVQMQQIKVKSQETALAAEQISTYCGQLEEKQTSVTNEVTAINDDFQTTVKTLRYIKTGTEDIVNRMQDVSVASKESYRDMNKLSQVLEEFKTASSVDEEVEEIGEVEDLSEVEDMESV